MLLSQYAQYLQSTVILKKSDINMYTYVKKSIQKRERKEDLYRVNWADLMGP